MNYSNTFMRLFFIGLENGMDKISEDIMINNFNKSMNRNIMERGEMIIFFLCETVH